MNSFDLGITSIGIPTNLDMSAGEASIREVTALQEGTERNDLRVFRAVTEPREFFRRLLRAVAFRHDDRLTPFTAVGSKPWLTVA